MSDALCQAHSRGQDCPPFPLLSSYRSLPGVVVRTTASGARLPGFHACVCHLPVVPRRPRCASVSGELKCQCVALSKCSGKKRKKSQRLFCDSLSSWVKAALRKSVRRSDVICSRGQEALLLGQTRALLPFVMDGRRHQHLR